MPPSMWLCVAGTRSRTTVLWPRRHSDEEVALRRAGSPEMAAGELHLGAVPGWALGSERFDRPDATRLRRRADQRDALARDAGVIGPGRDAAIEHVESGRAVGEVRDYAVAEEGVAADQTQWPVAGGAPGLLDRGRQQPIMGGMVG